MNPYELTSISCTLKNGTVELLFSMPHFPGRLFIATLNSFDTIKSTDGLPLTCNELEKQLIFDQLQAYYYAYYNSLILKGIFQ